MSRALHFHIYCHGAAGLNNVLMSIENGMILGKLLDRKVIFYQGTNKLWSGNRSPQYTNKYIQDIYNINADFVFGDIDKTIKSIPINLTDGLIYHTDYPDKDFIFGRKSIFNIEDFHNYNNVRTKSHLTLSFYSYLFFLNKNKHEFLVKYLAENIQPKSFYIDYQNRLFNLAKMHLGEFNVIHVRRGNTMGTSGLIPFNDEGEVVGGISVPEFWKDIPVSTFIDNLVFNLDINTPLIILSDEPESFYSPIIQRYKKVIILNQNLDSFYGLSLNRFEELEKWFIFSLLGVKAKNFIGTQGSTYSSLIQRQRLLNNPNESFRFLYLQKEYLRLEKDLSMREICKGKYSWNKVYPKDIISPAWSREWPEAVISY